MTSVRVHPVLAGATALALLMGSAAVAQQQQSTDQQGQAAQGTAQQDQQQASGQSGQQQESLAQIEQLLQQADQSLQQQDIETAQNALQQASDLLQQSAGGVDEQQMLDLQAQLQQALDALGSQDMQTAQAAVQDAQSTLSDVQQASSQQGGSQQATSQQATSQQDSSQQQPGQQASMQQGGQMSQDALMQLRDHLEMARLDLESAMDSVEQARQALDNLQPGMASAESQSLDVAVIRGDAAQTGAQSEVQSGQSDREIPRLSPEETQRLLGIGDRQIGEASERVTVSVGDLEDRDVVSYEGERIGEIGDVVNSGGRAVAIIEHGGFLGIGENRVAVPLERLGMRGDDLVLLGLTEEQMKALPDYDYEADQEMSNEDAIEIGRYE